MIRTLWMTLALLTAATAQIPYGQEFQVNSYTKGWQQGPAVAALVAGDFVVCWSFLGKDGGEADIFARRFNADGAPISQEFHVNSFIKDGQYWPRVAELAGGGFVVCWTSDGQDGDGYGVFAQRFDAYGKPVGLEFQVNTYIQDWQWTPAIAALAAGGFVVCWTSGGQDGESGDIFAQCFDAAGTLLGQELQVNSYTQNHQTNPAVVALADGGFVVCWDSWGQDGDESGIFAQRFDACGKPVGHELQVNSYTKSYQSSSAVAALADDSFVVCWTSFGQDGLWNEGIFAQRFNAVGTPVGQEFQVNSYMPSNQCSPAVAAFVDGFVVCWQSDNPDEVGWDSFAQRFDASGKTVGQELQVNSYSKGIQWNPAVALLDGGDFVVCWTSYGQDGFGSGIFAKRFPAQPLHHTLRPFKPLSPAYDATVLVGKPTLIWQRANSMPILYSEEVSYTVYYDTLADFSTAKVKTVQADTTLKLPALKLGTAYFWKVLAKTYYGDSLWSDVGAFFVSHTATGVEAEAVPGQFAVLSNYPNPFNPSTTIRFELPKDGYVTLKIYDLNGRLVKVFLSGEQTAGTHTAVWDATDDAGCRVAAGIYFYQLEFPDASGTRQVLTQKMSLVK